MITPNTGWCNACWWVAMAPARGKPILVFVKVPGVFLTEGVLITLDPVMRQCLWWAGPVHTGGFHSNI